MGGGFGPVVVSGQIALNHDVRPSVSIGDIAEIPVCIAGLLAFALIDNLSFLPIYLILLSAVSDLLKTEFNLSRVSSNWYMIQ